MGFVAGHFGEWLQGCLGPNGPVVLVTLMCPDRGVHVARTGDGALRLDSTAPVITLAQSRRMLAETGVPVEGRFAITPDLPPGGGAGMSTAALVALARAAGVTDSEALARACLAVEGASDPLMLPTPGRLLWASRQASVLRPMGPVPPCEIVGGFWGPPQRTNPRDAGFPDITDLIEAWPNADLVGKAKLASVSAQRCAALRGPFDDPVPGLAERLGALGHARAHTGSARALIFAPGAGPAAAESVLRDAGLTGVLRFRTGGAE